MKKKVSCELCNLPATTYCESDQASLCWHCDTKVHKANFLVTKHTRTLLCHLCQDTTPWTASGPMLPPSLSLCVSCANTSIHAHSSTTHHHLHNDAPQLHHHDNDDDVYDTYDHDHDDDEDESTDVGSDDDDEEEEEDEDEDDNQVVPLTTASTNSGSFSTEPEDDDDGVEDDGDGDCRMSSVIPSSLKRKREFCLLS
ncbi:B-box domain protein 30 [Bienertia sinuspersici]